MLKQFCDYFREQIQQRAQNMCETGDIDADLYQQILKYITKDPNSQG